MTTPPRNNPIPARRRVLIAEDGPESRRLIEVYLQSIGVGFSSVRDGEALANLAVPESFDLLLVDISLPVLDGVSAVKRLRARGYRGPIISISARCSSEDLAQYRDAGFDDCLAKPFARREFLAKLCAYLGLTPADGPSATTYADPCGELSRKFAASLPVRLEEMRAAYAKGDLSRVAEVAHKTRSAGMFGFQEVSDLCAQIDEALRLRASPRIPALFDLLEAFIQKNDAKT
jgi:CheY-like chemotaxis protein